MPYWPWNYQISTPNAQMRPNCHAVSIEAIPLLHPFLIENRFIRHIGFRTVLGQLDQGVLTHLLHIDIGDNFTGETHSFYFLNFLSGLSATCKLLIYTQV